MRECVRTASLAAAILVATAGARAATYNFSAQCTLQRHNGRTWDPLPASMLPGRIRDPLTRRGGKALFRIGSSWYQTDETCLTQNRIDPLARGEAGRGRDRDSERGPHRWVFDLGGGFALLSGSRFSAGTSTTGGYSIARTAVSSAIPLGIGVGYRLSESLMLRYFVTRMKTSQTGQFSGSVGGTAVYEHEFYHFGAGAVKHFEPIGKLRPYAGVEAGYSLDSGLYTLSGFEGIFAGLNGGVDVNSTGFFFGARGGADWQLDPKWSVFADLGYQLTLYGDGKVNRTTTSFYTAGETVPYSSASRILLMVGGRYWL